LNGQGKNNGASKYFETKNDMLLIKWHIVHLDLLTYIRWQKFGDYEKTVS